MNTCERCGADAVDAHGTCRNCGWRAPQGAANEPDSRPSLGATRAADFQAFARSRPRGRAGDAADGGASVAGRVDRPVESSWRAVGGGLPPVAAGHGASGDGAHYCGACGASLEPGRAYCGQCGAPVANEPAYAAGHIDARQSAPSSPRAPGRYAVGPDGTWQPGDHDAPTEAIPDLGYFAPPPLQQPGPYGYSPTTANAYATGYRSGVAAPRLDTPSGTSRTWRIMLGMACLGGSLVSAAVAIVLALH